MKFQTNLKLKKVGWESCLDISSLSPVPVKTSEDTISDALQSQLKCLQSWLRNIEEHSVSVLYSCLFLVPFPWVFKVLSTILLSWPGYAISCRVVYWCFCIERSIAYTSSLLSILSLVDSYVLDNIPNVIGYTMFMLFFYVIYTVYCMRPHDKG
jgi:hypothetical protein